jgi:recombination protein RecA
VATTKKAPAKKAPAKKAAASAREKFAERFAKNFGDKSLDRTGKITPYKVISTGSLDLDQAMGAGGWVQGRLGEIWGVDAIGKTTLAYHSVAEAQKQYPDLLVGWIDMEHTLDKRTSPTR